MIYVTHDQVEAMTMADRIVVLRGGRVEQVGTPLELYNAPANRFVAGFIGSPQMNFLGGSVAAARAEDVASALDAAPRRVAQTACRCARQAAAGARVWLGHPARAHSSSASPPSAAQSLTVTIERIEQLGAASFLYCSLASGENLTVHAPGQVAHDVGARITVHLPVVDAHVFDSCGQASWRFRASIDDAAAARRHVRGTTRAFAPLRPRIGLALPGVRAGGRSASGSCSCAMTRSGSRARGRSRRATSTCRGRAAIGAM